LERPATAREPQLAHIAEPSGVGIAKAIHEIGCEGLSAESEHTEESDPGRPQRASSEDRARRAALDHTGAPRS
jgi:hypothetical protein